MSLYPNFKGEFNSEHCFYTKGLVNNDGVDLKTGWKLTMRKFSYCKLTELDCYHTFTGHLANICTPRTVFKASYI